MCGIAGLWKRDSTPEKELEALAAQMASSILHRGPDDAGIWTSAESGVALCFRRLAILDLSPAGHQPMISETGRYTLVFNGEIYNAFTYQPELIDKGHKFRGHSDTEIMLAAFEEWGLKASIPRFNGMYAFAVWDRETRSLTLCRDRVGIKPLYYGWDGRTLRFGSELKAFCAHEDFKPEIDSDAVTDFLEYGYIPGTRTIYRNVWKLPPGSFITLAQPGADSKPEAYWSMPEIVARGIGDRFRGSEQEAVDELESLLTDSVRLRLLSDVPLGAFLSGGIDSSTVVALMQTISSKPVKTFTIGFDESGYDEAAAARQVAKHLGTDHTELYLKPQDALSIIPCLPRMFDEPFADSSQIPTFLVSRLARSQVTVSLSGDGGDELFAGYNRYMFCASVWSRIRPFPRPLRAALGKWFQSSDPAMLGRVFAPLSSVGKLSGRQGPIGHKLRKLAPLLGATDMNSMISAFGRTQTALDLAARGFDRQSEMLAAPMNGLDAIEQMQYSDLVRYLPEDILAKVDRASMAVSLEARVPVLDYRIVEFAWRIPMNMKLRDGKGKWLLRQVLHRHVPAEMFDRPKSGFAMPVAEWLRGPLRDWGESLISERNLDHTEFLEKAKVRERWLEHQSGDWNWDASLWKILTLLAWKQEWVR